MSGDHMILAFYILVVLGAAGCAWNVWLAFRWQARLRRIEQLERNYRALIVQQAAATYATKAAAARPTTTPLPH